jgi:hypothetical protein
MAGLGLMNALDAYQQGVSWKQGQDEIARAKHQRAALDEANAAATGVITASQQEWAVNGAQGQYKPNDSTMFKAAEARGQALAKHGLWDQYMQNEAQIAPMRLRARSTALQRYQADGDVEALARSVYPTIFDGKEIVGIERVEGAPGSENLGLAARSSTLKLKLSDGTETTTDPQRLVQLVKQSLIDPQTTLKNEIELNMARAKAEAEAAGRVTVERERGEQARKTEGVKAENAVQLQGVKFGQEKELAGLNNASREKVAAGNNSATLGAAHIGASARKEAAQIGAASKAESGPKKDQQFDQLHDELVRVYGETQMGALGGTKTATEGTQAMAAYAQALMKADPNMTVAQAIRKSSEEWKKRNPGWDKGRKSGLGG